MKKLLMFTLLLGSAAVMADDTRPAAIDMKLPSSLCIVSTSSDTSVGYVARELGVRMNEGEEGLCNGSPIRRFISDFRNGAPAQQEASERDVYYLVDIADQSMATRLCLAAVTSRYEFEKLRQSVFKGVRVEDEVACNGKPLEQFVRHYRDHVSSGALKTAGL